jgi:hypothetical protein
MAARAADAASATGAAAPRPAPLRLCCACGGTEGGVGAEKQRRLLLCTACRGALFCDAACQAAVWHAHRHTCRAVAAGGTPAALVPAAAYGGPPRAITDVLLQPGDPRLAPGAPVSPLLRACGIELRVVRLTPQGGLLPSSEAGRAALDNQLATFLMADARSGLAPPAWQAGVGDVVLYRTDGMPLTARHAWALWDWVFDLMNMYGGDEPLEATSARWLTRRAFGGMMRQRTVEAAEARARRAQRRADGGGEAAEEEEVALTTPAVGVAF